MLGGGSMPFLFLLLYVVLFFLKMCTSEGPVKQKDDISESLKRLFPKSAASPPNSRFEESDGRMREDTFRSSFTQTESRHSKHKHYDARKRKHLDRVANHKFTKVPPMQDYHFPYRPKFLAHPLLGMCHIEDFVFNEADRVGRGGFGQVFRAVHKSGKVVAIKLVGADSIKDRPKHVENEETIHRILTHPNIGQLLCSMRNSKNDIFFVMEFYDGGNLSKQLSTMFPLSRPLMVKYIAQVIKALRFIHSHCIIYRDLKAENIMIDQLDNIRLVDFGLSVYDCDGKQSNMAGTIEYVAPEVAARTPYSREADLYSLGVLVYLLKMGKLPYKRRKEDKDKFAARIASGEVRVPNTGDALVDEIISYLTDRDQKRRWQRVYHEFESFKKLPFFAGYDWEDCLETISIRPGGDL